MRLQRATTVNRLQGDDELGLTREERQERRQRRRARRRARRDTRREARLERKAEKLRARADKLDQKAGGGSRRERRAMRRGQAPGYPPDGAYPQDQGYPPDQAAYPDGWTPSGYPDDGSLPDDDAPPMEPGEVDLEPAPDGTEGIGWSWPRLRRGRRAAGPVAPAPPIPADLPTALRRGAVSPSAPQLPALWSPPARMGSHMRIQASSGYRAAVVELKPGLFVVAEIPAQVAASEMGFGAVLAPLLVRAASRAAARREAQAQAQPMTYVQQPDGSYAPVQPAPERRGFFSLFRRSQAASPGSAPQQPWPGQPVAALPGPVAEDAPVAGPIVVAVPRVARWADPEDVAGVLAGPLVRARR